ncbi:MAG: serine protease [Acidimicrobiales bacterium]
MAVCGAVMVALAVVGVVARPRGAGSTVGLPVTEVAGAVELAPAALTAATSDHLAIVRVSASRCGERVHGSGVLVADGVVVTAAHVVGDAGLVRIDQGSLTVTGEVLGRSGDGRDLALIAVDGPLREPARSGPVPRIGATVTVVGYPFGGPLTSEVGRRVDVTGSLLGLARGPSFAVDIVTSVGMSGAPALDDRGRIVGIVIGAETTSHTAVVLGIDDAGALAGAALVPGGCPIGA